MRLFSFLLILLISLSNCTTTDAQPSPSSGQKEDSETGKPIKVLCYNIHHSNPPSKPDFIDLEAIANVIRNSGADIVGLQEVDVFTKRSGQDLHMAKALAEMTGMDYYYFSKGIDYQGGEYGTAILSKFPLSDTQTHLLPAEKGTEQRTLSVATVTLEDQSKIKFANTHLDYTSISNALSQAAFIVDYFKDEPLPSILVGDFNAVPTSDPIQLLDKTFTRTCSNCAPTIPVDQPNRAIDFIMYRSASAFSVNMHKVIQEKYASDHLPVLSTLLLNTAQE
ncbi:endonuclease/exonuclease/phosphatase family protein [Echinicola sediminis]